MEKSLILLDRRLQMIREIMRDETLLAQKAEPATRSDLPVAQDLLNTLEANKERCVGMAANRSASINTWHDNKKGALRNSNTIHIFIPQVSLQTHSSVL